MEDIKSIIAENIAALRKGNAMTQIELAERLNYSDKAISKWERGESVPDITVLKSIADIFGVTVDYLITREHNEIPPELTEKEIEKRERRERKLEKKARLKKTHAIISAMSVLLVWLVATLVFVILDASLSGTVKHLLVFSAENVKNSVHSTYPLLKI